MNQKSKKLEAREEFVKKYRAALKANISKEQFARYLGIKDDSVIRRRLVIKETIGLDLPFLRSDNIEITEENLRKFRTELGKLTKEDNKVASSLTDDSQFDRFVITSAQNCTPINENFLASILNYQKFHDKTTFKVIKYRYKNPTSIFQDKDHEYWDERLVKYFHNEKTQIFDNLLLIGNHKVQATCGTPCNKALKIVGKNSGIVGHPRVQWLTVPTPNHLFPKIVASTGAITIPNYTDTATGDDAHANHKYAAIILELDRINNIFHIRHIYANAFTGEFYDIAGGVLRKYGPNSITESERLTALVPGDIHAFFIDPVVEEATFTGKNSLLNLFKPKTLIVHDLLDAYTISHWHRHSYTTLMGKFLFNRDNLENELQITADVLDNMCREDMETIIVDSNHNGHLDKWLDDCQHKLDFKNENLYLYLRRAMNESIRPTETGFSRINPLEFWCHHPYKERGLKNKHLVRFLKPNEPLTIQNIEFSLHGDKGAGGAKGSEKSFARCGIMMVVGHRHASGVFEGVTTVGVTARMNLEYKMGLDAWLQSHALVYPDGAITLINIIKGRGFL